jgi:mannose-6-phosphate isomerase-like protein (cupin superfamily)
LSVPDLAERSLGGREPVRTVPIGCSGLSQAQLFVVRETREVPARIDADEMLYIVAGEGTMQLSGKAQIVTPGWFSIVPRGMTYSVTRKGKNPTVLLSIIGGQACAPVIHQ